MPTRLGRTGRASEPAPDTAPKSASRGARNVAAGRSLQAARGRRRGKRRARPRYDPPCRARSDRRTLRIFATCRACHERNSFHFIDLGSLQSESQDLVREFGKHAKYELFRPRRSQLPAHRARGASKDVRSFHVGRRTGEASSVQGPPSRERPGKPGRTRRPPPDLACARQVTCRAGKQSVAKRRGRLRW